MDPIATEKGTYQPVGEKLSPNLPPLVRKFFTGVLTGKFVPVTDDQLRGMVRDQFASTPPLTPLSTDEEAVLLRNTTKVYVRDEGDILKGNVLANDKWQALAEEVIHIPPDPALPVETRNPRNPHKIITGAYSRDEFAGRTPLTPVEKEDILTDPDIYTRCEWIDYGESDRRGGVSHGLTGNGTRHLCDDGRDTDTYRFTEDSFRDLLATVRSAQGKSPTDHLTGLDIGGSNGLGAHDAEALDPNLDVTNLNLALELGMYPLRGGHVFAPGERMPADFKEKYDIIISNAAFTYMTYPDIAFKNSLEALNTGGIMRINFNTVNSPLGAKEVVPRVAEQIRLMEAMERQGLIKFIPPPDGLPDAHEIWKNRGDKLFPPDGILQVQKIKSFDTGSITVA